jgi:transposase
MKDTIAKEVWETRHEIEREFGHDVNEYLKHVYKAQKKHGDRLVRRQPKLLKRRKVM